MVWMANLCIQTPPCHRTANDNKTWHTNKA